MIKPYIIDEQIRITELFSMFECHRDKDYFFRGETHDFWECVYVIDGDICVSGDERVYHIHKNDIVFHKPLELHKYYNEAENGSDLLIFSFNTSGKLTKYYENKVFHLNTAQESLINQLIAFVRSNKISSCDCNIQIYLEPANKSVIYLQYLSSVLEQLLLSLYEESAETSASKAPDVIIFRKAVKYMNKNLDKQISINSLSKECNVSPTGIKRIFGKYSGLGIHKYFLTLKINKAAQYLKSHHSVTEISELLGFSSQAYFSHVFKRETGLSPTEYIKQSNMNVQS